jgi:hypothetical protein
MPSGNLPTDTHAAPPAGVDTRIGDRAYETRDVNIRAILWLGAGTILGAALVHVGLWLLLDRYELAARRSDRAASPLAETDFDPPGPHLQHESIGDYAKFRASEEETLNSYGWVDKQQGIVRIPVSRAMDLVLERGLPQVEAQPSESDEPSQEKQE